MSAGSLPVYGAATNNLGNYLTRLPLSKNRGKSIGEIGIFRGIPVNTYVLCVCVCVVSGHRASLLLALD